MTQRAPERIPQLCADTGCHKVLLDGPEMGTPSLGIVEAQRMLNPELKAHEAQLAMVGPNSWLTWLTRLQRGEENHKVFYNDIAGASTWLIGH